MADRRKMAEDFLACIEEGRLADSLAHLSGFCAEARVDEAVSLYGRAKSAEADLLLSGRDFDPEDLEPLTDIDALFWTKVDREHHFLSFEAVNDALSRLKGISDPMVWAGASLYSAWIAAMTVASRRLGLRPITFLLKGRSYDLKQCLEGFDRKFPEGDPEIRDVIGYSISLVTDLWYVFDREVSGMPDRDIYIFDECREGFRPPEGGARPLTDSLSVLISAPSEGKKEAADAMDGAVKAFVASYLACGISAEQRERYGKKFDSVKAAAEAQRGV
ncbi:MAG: hypothetical protein LKJ94_00420 [Candidatus Methanomethylophilus sp.]|jgi:hypothetical protein|nr:hypothetical protein [Methanomethylophilus sp.]MCI2074165.1 hypothetical protein [Methanomethylophilus sp.]MCI2093038.1 hypothetical protein [Methanomethylophilus sp.]